jgi:hypothetical protein
MPDRFKPGSRPPYIALSEALRLVALIYEQGGGRASKDLLSRLTGNTSSSSSFVRKINALKAYGLAGEEGGQIFLSAAGTAAAAPTDPSDAAEARKVSFEQIEIFRRVYERHKGKILPADEFLKNILEQEHSIPRELVGEWLLSLKDGLKAAGLLYDRGDGKMQIMEKPIVRFPRLSTDEAKTNQSQVTTVAPSETPSAENVIVQSAQFASGHSTRIELSGKRFASFSIPDILTARDASKLKSAIAGLSAIIDSMVQEEVL